MISVRMVWLLGALLLYAAVLMGLYGMPTLYENDTAWVRAHGFSYAGFGALLLGALARSFPQAGPNTWRVATLVLGAVAAGVGAWLIQKSSHASSSFDAWMAALLGLAIVVMLPPWLPTSATCRWLGLDRRRAPRA